MARDITLGETIDFKFVSTAAATGAPTVLAGTPVISAYVGNSTTQITAGITLTVDFDGVVGLNNVRLVATGGNGYTDNTDVAFVITTGTVGGTSAVGYVVEQITIGRSAAYTRLGAPAGASVSADIVTLDNFIDTEVAAILAAVDTEVAAILADTDEVQISLAAGGLIESMVDDLQAEVDGIQADTEDIQTRLPAALVGGRMDSSVGAMAANVMTAAAAAADLTTELQTGLATAAALATVSTNVDDLKSGIIYGAAATGTLSTTQATSNLTGYTNDQLIGRVLIVLSGVAEGEATDITDYVEVTGLLTFTALTIAMANTDTFKIV